MQADSTDLPLQAPAEQGCTQQAHLQHEAKAPGSPVSMPAHQVSSDSPPLSKKRKRDDSEATDTADMSVGSQADLDDATRTAATSSEPGKSAADPLPNPAAPQASSLSIARSPSTASVHAHSNTHKADAETTHARDEKSCEDGDVVWRSRDQLAACLSCDLCSEVLNDPVTAPECMHSYCRDCVDKHVLYGGTRNLCPVCKAEGLETVLGPQPFQHGKLQFDPMLADMIKKLFPRAEVEKGIQERRDADAKWRASLPVKKPKPAATKPNQSVKQKSPAPVKASEAALNAQHQQVASASAAAQDAKQGVRPEVDPKVTLFLQTDEQHRLPLPYLRVNPGLNFGLLASFVCNQLQLNPDLYGVDLYCEGVLLQSEGVVNSVLQHWLKQHKAQEAMIISVRTFMR